MPEPPPVGLLTRYVLENPFPVALPLIAVGATLAWSALRDARRTRFRIGIAAVVLGVVAIALGLAVTTAGEHGERAARGLVEAVVGNDLVGARAMMTDETTLSIGSPLNPGVGIDFIQDRLDQLHQRYRIEANTIRSLSGYGISADEAEIHLGCLTDAGFGFTPSRWVLRARRQPDGTWKITRITCISINNQVPASNRMW